MTETYKMPCAPSEDSDQPGHTPPPQSDQSPGCELSGQLKDPSFLHADTKGSDWTGGGGAQADLSLCWARMPFCRFCRVLAPISVLFG